LSAIHVFIMKLYHGVLRQGVQIIGHRGSMATHPENTVPGFRHAMTCGADGVELDVAVTLDEQLVVTHDLILKPDGREVRGFRAADLPLPTLDEVLELAAPENFWFDIEAKTPGPPRYAQLLSEAIRRSPRADRVLVRSFDHDLLRAFHALALEIPLAALIAYGSDEWVTIARSAGASIISPHVSTVNEERVARAHDGGIGVSVWTVNDPREWERLATMGVDAIITDDPAAAVRYFLGREE
jgi:glycerophosphoryl diester phosphodiesterase